MSFMTRGSVLIGSLAAVASVAAPAAGESEAPEAKLRRQVQAELGLAVIGIAYEHPILEHVSVQVSAELFSTYFAPWFDIGEQMVGFGGQVRPTWFLRRTGRGLYVAPFFRAAPVWGDVNGEGGSGIGFSTGVWVGWAFGLTRRLDLRAGAGAQYMYYRVETDTGRETIDTPFVALDAVLGYRL